MLIDDDLLNLVALKKILIRKCKTVEIAIFLNGLDALSLLK